MGFTIPPATERAWAAGFFDGEGHCSYGKNPRGDCVMLSVVQTKETATLERFQAAVGGYGNIYERNHRPEGWSRTWVIQIGAYREVQQAACLMWEFLSEPKRRQIAEALAKYKQYQADAASRRPAGFRWSNQKLSDAQVLEIKAKVAAGDRSQRSIADEYGISQYLVSKIKLGRHRIGVEKPHNRLTAYRFPGHAPVQHSEGGWRCSCGLPLSSGRTMARVVMRAHRYELLTERQS